MRRLLTIFLISIVFSNKIAIASPLDPVPDLPKWATPQCLTTIGRIVQHEVGLMDSEAYRFLAEQVVYDIRRLGCDNLTNWRWKIGAYPASKVTTKVKRVAEDVVLDYPLMGNARCQLVGSLGDVAVWRRAGYRVNVDYRHSVGNLTVIGVNCK